MAVLKVNVGTAAVPDFRKIGCGGAAATPTTQTFTYLSAAQTFVVPAGVTTVTAECWGAQGGAAFGTPNGTALGGYIKADITVTPGETLTILTGGRPPNTAGGGGPGGPTSAPGARGGGGTDVRRGGVSLADRVVIAGGGGGAGVNSNGGNDGNTYRDGGPGGGSTGGDSNSTGLTGSTAIGGKGGTQSAGGAAGSPATGGGTTATAGSSGQGGQGASEGPGTNGTGSGGGGGGYFGGGGGGWQVSSQMPGGGGGSSFSSGTILANTQGVQAGDGKVTLTYAGATTVGRLKLWDGTQWVKEKCAASAGTSRPLKMNAGTPSAPMWVTVACMVPA